MVVINNVSSVTEASNVMQSPLCFVMTKKDFLDRVLDGSKSLQEFTERSLLKWLHKKKVDVLMKYIWSVCPHFVYMYITIIWKFSNVFECNKIIHRVRKRLYLFFFYFFFLGAQCVESGVSCTDCYWILLVLIEIPAVPVGTKCSRWRPPNTEGILCCGIRKDNVYYHSSTQLSATV